MSQVDPVKVKDFLSEAIGQGRSDLVQSAAAHFGVSRQTVHRYLSEMVSVGELEATGRTRGRTYGLKTLAAKEVCFPAGDRPAEDRVWRESFAPLLEGVARNVRDICNYGFTEMFNNATEHSSASSITAGLRRTCARIHLYVADDGIGVFRKVREGLNLADEREAILELAKGKVTTDAASHTGEGIFFTTRMFDSFSLLANGLFFRHLQDKDDWLIELRPQSPPGTSVAMELSSTTARTVTEVFDKYTTDLEVPTFDKTRVPVRLLRVGDEYLISRSQAKRLLARFARFREVALDFEGVDRIGQAFADEIFRVYANQNPGVHLVVLRANAEVQTMIRRAAATAAGDARPARDE